jgi:hypothetical protein
LYDVRVSEPQPSPPAEAKPTTPQRRPFQGWGSAAGNGLEKFASTLIKLTSKLYGHAVERGGAALTEFQARPEHSRWRAYAMGSYGFIVAATLLGQLYTENSLGVSVRVQKVEMPALTQIFVRNDSQKPWKGVKLTLNGIYTYETLQVDPGAFILLPADRFAVFDSLGHKTFAPKAMEPKTLLLETRDGKYLSELQK